MKNVILADESITLPEFPEVKIVYGALTAKQYRQAAAIKMRYAGEMSARFPEIKSLSVTGCPEWVDFLCRHGIRSISGLQTQEGDGGKPEPVFVAIEEGPYGPCITEESWDNIYPFLGSEVLVLALRILERSRTE